MVSKRSTISNKRRVHKRVSDPKTVYVNYYRCPDDGTHWADSWSCMCNDRCPRCGHEIEPYKSVGLIEE